MSNAVERVRQRLILAAGALDAAGVPYAIVGGNAVAAWVSRVDESAVRNTRDVDVLLKRDDLAAARAALEAAGFIYRHAAGLDLFLDGPEGRARDAVHIVYAQELVRPSYPEPAPAVEESERTNEFRLLSLQALVRMKLTSFRDRDRVHLRDLMDVGLVDAGWLEDLPPALAERLRILLENPEG